MCNFRVPNHSSGQKNFTALILRDTECLNFVRLDIHKRKDKYFENSWTISWTELWIGSCPTLAAADFSLQHSTVLEMSPRKPAKSLFTICLDVFIKHLIKYIDRKTFKINFFNDFEKASKEFLARCETGQELVDDYFIGTLRYQPKNNREDDHHHIFQVANSQQVSPWEQSS